MRTSRLPSDSAGVKQTSLMPASLTFFTASPGGMPPANTTWPIFSSMQTSTRASRSGCMVIRLTPNGCLVRSLVPRISARNSSGDIEPVAMTPKPPALEIAATRWRSETHDIAPPRMA